MNRPKRLAIIFMAMLLILLQIPWLPMESQQVQAASEITPLRYYKDKNYRYFVGMMYYEMWRSTDGSWTDGGRQPNKGMRGEATFTYKFQFPGRKIKNVEARIYNPGDPVEYFEQSRYDSYREFKKSISTGTTDSDIRPFQKQGVGTSSTTIPITVNMLLDAEDPLDVKDQQCPSCAESVRAYRIHIPILFKIELDSGLTVKHFTESGTSLDSIFPPRSEELTVGNLYEFTPPTHPDYEYVGYKKSSQAAVPSGSIQEGTLPSLTYDGSFENYTVYLYYKPLVEEPPPDPEEPAVVCGPPASAGVQTGSLMNGSAVGKIKADNRGSEKFEVAKGIPTSESLYGVVQARTYLYNNKFEKFTGTCTFTVPVSKTYNLKWEEEEQYDNSKGETKTRKVKKSSTVTVNPSYEIVRPYSYWTIPELQAFKIDHAKLQNYAFEGGEIVIRPGSSYNSPTMKLETYEEHLEPPVPVSGHAPSQTIDGGSSEPDVPNENLKSYAEAATPQLNVRNDDLDFNNTNIMDGTIVKTNGPTPGKIPTPTSIDANALYKPNNMIPKTKANRADNESTGTIRYLPLEGSLGEPDEQVQPVGDLNPVTVHTPVVMYPAVSNDKQHNQRVSPASDRAALVLDRPFTVTVPTSGPHRDIRGYGNRDYAKYTAYKQVLFEFDVYNESMQKYIPKNTWIDLPIGDLQTNFRMPVWVDEGNYTVHFRAIAENAPTGFTWQSMANTDLTHHVAVNQVPVQVIGRLYDFKITDIADYDWETVFRTKKGSSEPTGAAYWVGPNSIDGAKRGNTFPYVLPIRPGSHPNEGYKNVTIKTGYHFKFDFKTKGNLFGQNDRVRIVPTFYFVNKDGSNRQKVDLYYHNQTTGQKFVKIGSAQDTVQRSIILDDRLRNVPDTQISNTAKFVATYGNLQFEQQAKQKAAIGGYSQLMLTQRVRTMIGPTQNIPDGVNKDRAVAAVQQWYGEYSLPAAPYVVPAGFNIAEYGRTNKLTDKAPIFLRNGYIVVNFNIETYRAGIDGPYLRYYRLPGATTPLDNQWKLEGYSSTAKDRYGHSFSAPDGDVVYYHGNLSSYDDFKSTVTH